MLKLEKTSFLDCRNCLLLTNGDAELIITTEIGPRIISYRECGGKNFFHVFPDHFHADPAEWHNYGGHRLWHAPEVHPRTYHPDNTPVEYAWDGQKLTLDCPEETTTRMQKVITVELADSGTEVRLEHRIYNRNPWSAVFAPWCLSVMASGGRLILPQEPFVPHGHNPGESLEPARPLVLWPYTRMNDPRFVWGDRYIQMKQDDRLPSKQKFGVTNKQGWAAYVFDGKTFIKRHDYEPDAVYPDLGCNAEFFTMPGFLEIESLGRLDAVEPGAFARLDEHWSIRQVSPSEDEDDIASQLEGIV